MLARGQEAHSLRVQAKHNFCLIAKIGEMMNTKDKNSVSRLILWKDVLAMLWKEMLPIRGYS